ncbi:dephospho-CoA kinase [Chloroflexota bacterium]
MIGLTGGIGSGKSTVARFLGELGAAVIDTDKLWHEAIKPDRDMWREVVVAFGEEILQSSREIDRRKLGEIVFANPEALDRLNGIVHPWMYDKVKGDIEENRRQGMDVVVLEIPLLVEDALYMRAGQPSLTDEVDEVWVAVAPENTVLKRLEDKRLSRDEALARIRSQISSVERIKHADVVIDTDCPLDELKDRVRQRWAQIEV